VCGAGEGAGEGVGGVTVRADVAAVLTRLPITVAPGRVVGEGLGGERERCTFVLHGSPHFPDGLAVTVRSQWRGGTTDEKLYALGVNIPATYRLPTILVLVGDGFRDGIVTWLQTRTGATLRAVLRLEDLEGWLWGNL